MADLDGQWRTWTDIGRLGRTLADSDGHWRTQTDSFCKGQACLPRSQNKGEFLSLGTDRIGVLAAGPDSAGFESQIRQAVCLFGDRFLVHRPMFTKSYDT